MGSSQSTHTTSEITETPKKQESPPSSVSGRKQSNEDNVLVEPHVISTDEDTDSVVSSELGYEEESDDDSDEEEDEEWNERVQILQDARNLKKLADFFLYPDKPVVGDATATARCFFSRPSAPQAIAEEEEEVARILADARALKNLAVDYLQPERPVQVDPMLFGRNYFTRPSAPTSEEDEERNQILADALALKRLAVDYLHPENPVVTSDPCATGRNYFSRYSAEGADDEGLASERDQILADAESLKKLAVDYLHPEKPVVTSDPYATGRNYFTRYSAVEQEDEDIMDEREEVLEDVAELKRLAEYYMKPENPVAVDALVSCRCYFDRPSALPQEEQLEAEEREKILADAQVLKQLAVDYLHPERPVVTTDPFAMGRNYFTRPSAGEYEEEEAIERDMILADMAQLKKLAVDYLHPENPVVTSDPCATGRNFFSRFSAEEYDDSDDLKFVLEDAAALKKLAVEYLHPEKPVVTDGFAKARNYFSRYTAEEQEDEDTMDEREEILQDMNELKRLAQDYLQPERPVQVDPMLFGRNYFTRPSAPTSEEDEERNQILADALALKRLAVDYLHPENPVVTSDPCATGRNYFSRYSAEGADDEGLASERDQILADAESLKKLAVDYLHPEKPVVTSDPYATGRNYFTRPSAEEFDEEEDKERTLVLDDVAALKKLAVDYLCPERPVETDAFAKGRNYFSRYSAEEQEVDLEEVAEKDRILEDMRLLKQLAVDYMQPELPVKTTDPSACGRNYFNRATAVGPSEQIRSEGHSIHQAQQHDVVESVHHHDLGYSDHEYYHYHPDDHLHSDHHSQSDHFEMDEDMAQDFRDFRESLHTMVPLKGAEAPREEDEGKLSRSPSSVMLFDEAAM